MKKYYLLLLLALQTSAGYVLAQNVGINATGTLPDPKAMLDISSTSSGLLIPRMTTAQRDAITAPAMGLQVFNLTTNTLDIFRGTKWEAVGYTDPTSSVVNVTTLSDLPAPSGGVITLVPGKIYSFSGLVNIGTNYLNLNGAALRGNNPVGDGLLSSVSGAVLRSTDQHVFLQNLLVVLGTNATTAYNFSDGTGTKSCNIVSGNNVKQAATVTSSAGVGQFSGFRAVILLQNYFDVNDGFKVTGTMGRLICGYNLLGNILPGKVGIEFLPGLVVQDVDISNTHFIYSGTGQTGVKLDVGATVDYGRMTTDMFRNVTTPISGFDGSTPGWSMQNNTGIPNTRAQAFLYMNNNTTVTGFSNTTAYYKIAGTTTLIRSQKFTASNNQITYIGKAPTSVQVTAVIGGKSPQSGADYSIVLAKNGTAIPTPEASMGSMLSGQGFQIVLTSDVDLVPGDYLEVGIRNNAGTTSVVISDLQFRVTE
jgi:hypothetical protein